MRTRLLEDDNRRPSSLKDMVLIKTTSFGLCSLSLAAYIAFTGKLLSLQGSNGTAAGSITTPTQLLFNGINIGILLATGFEIGPPIGRGDYATAGNIAKASWAFTLGLGTASSLVMIAASPLLQFIYEKETAAIASSFLYGCSAVNIPMLVLTTSPQIAFQAGDWFIPPAAGLLFLLLAGSSSYIFGHQLGMGAFGTGLGGGVGGLLACLPLQAWFLRDHYKEYKLYSLPILNWRESIKAIWKSGWRLSAQRLTEWGNLTVISTLLGNSSLQAAQPSFQYLGLVAVTVQGIAQATGMIISKNKGAIKAAENNPLAIRRLLKNNTRTLILNNLASAASGGLIAISFYFARKPLTNFLLTDVSPETQSLSESLLWITMLGLIPDSIRLVTGGALRAWDDLLYPTVVSFLTMSLLGISLAMVLTKFCDYEEAETMFWVRNITMLMASLLIGRRCYQRVSEDYAAVDALEPDRPEARTSLANNCFSFFPRSSNAVPPEAGRRNPDPAFYLFEGTPNLAP